MHEAEKFTFKIYNPSLRLYNLMTFDGTGRTDSQMNLWAV